MSPGFAEKMELKEMIHLNSRVKAGFGGVSKLFCCRGRGVFVGVFGFGLVGAFLAGFGSWGLGSSDVGGVLGVGGFGELGLKGLFCGFPVRS